MTKHISSDFSRFTRRAAKHVGYTAIDALSLGLARIVLDDIVRSPIDERLAKINEAKKNLSEALLAIEDLKDEATTNSRALEQLTLKLNAAETQKTLLQKDIETLRSLATLDAEGVRKSLGIPSRLQVWFERGLSFFIGVVASLVASWLWTLFMT